MRFARTVCSVLSGGLGLGACNLQSKRRMWFIVGELSRALALEASNDDRGRDIIQKRAEYRGRGRTMTSGMRLKGLIGLRT